MTRAIYYPKASRTAQWFGDTYSGSVISSDKGLWHTTETAGWPAYGGGASAPHLTFNPWTLEWRQHFRLDRSARALKNLAGGIETNTDHVVQIEIIAYSQESLNPSKGISKISQAAKQALADFTRWLNVEWGVPFVLASDWRPVGAGSLRFSFTEWRAFTGWCGHIHVPENTHWDPGALDVWTIMELAKGDGDLVTTQGEFNILMSNWWNAKLFHENGSQDPAKVDRELTNLRVAPWHQLLGAGPLNMHGAMGELINTTRELKIQNAALIAAVTALTESSDLTAEEMTIIIHDAIASAVIDVEVTVKDEVNEPPPA